MKTYIFDFHMDDRWIKKFRFMIAGLIASCTLNIALLLAFFFSVSEIKKPQFFVSRSSKAQAPLDISYRDCLTSMSKLSFAELIAFLTNQDLVEEGLKKRDLAVAALTSFHNFHLEKAIGSPPPQKREIALSEEEKIAIYPGLDDEQFEAIIRFAYQEKWPLTPKGLFGLLKKKNMKESDETLIQAFFSTPEFYALQILFQKTQAIEAPLTLLKLASEGTWEHLEQFAQNQSQCLDLSIDKRRQLLMDYMIQGSQTAAELLLKTDFIFVRQRLDDPAICHLISLLHEKTPDAEKLCLELLSAPRTDSVWKAAAEKLYAFAQEPLPSPFHLEAVLARFIPNRQSKQPPPPLSPVKQHIVKEGENLWKIARQYKVKVDDLVKANDLAKDQLQPGMILLIP